MADAGTAAAPGDAAMALEDGRDGRDAGQERGGEAVGKQAVDLLGTPLLKAVELEDALDDLGRGGVGTAEGPTGAVTKSRRPLGGAAGDPLVGGLARDAEALGEEGDRVEAALVLANQLKAKVHG